METFISDISKKTFPANEAVSGRSLRSDLLTEIRKDSPDFSEDQHLSLTELNIYRQRYIENTLKEELGTLTSLEDEVLESIRKGEIIAENVDEEIQQRLTFGERMSDRIADFGGSWPFIILFSVFVLFWMLLNSLLVITKPPDPYPFIFLNLILSCIAAIQAPIIMMSQNRMETRDRERAKHDYQVNLKAELEIRMLNEKIDHLILNQQHKLLDIQEIQIEMLKDIMEKISDVNKDQTNV